MSSCEVDMTNEGGAFFLLATSLLPITAKATPICLFFLFHKYYYSTYSLIGYQTIVWCRRYESTQTHPLSPSPLVCCSCGCRVKCATAGPAGGGRRHEELPLHGQYNHRRRSPLSSSPPHLPPPSPPLPPSP